MSGGVFVRAGDRLVTGQVCAICSKLLSLQPPAFILLLLTSPCAPPVLYPADIQPESTVRLVQHLHGGGKQVRIRCGLLQTSQQAPVCWARGKLG